jgi:hypothetical protein
MTAERRMALSVFASSLFLRLVGIIISSLFTHTQELKRADFKSQPFALSNPNSRDREPLPQRSKGKDCGCNLSSTPV